MRLKNSEIFNARTPLEELLRQRLPIKTSYKLAQTAAKLNEQLTIIDRVRLGLFETYGEKDPVNRLKVNIDPQSENFPKFASELGELMSEEVDMDIEVITLPDTLEIEPASLMLLEKFITIN